METSFSSSSFGDKEPQQKYEDSHYNDSYPKPRDIGYQQFLNRYQNAVGVGTKTPETTTSKNGNDGHEDPHRPTLSYGFSSTSTETDGDMSKQQRRVGWIRCLLRLLILSAIACLIAFEFGALSKRKQGSSGVKGLNSTQSTSPSTSSSAQPSAISTDPRRNNDVHPNAPNANANEGGTAIVTTDDSNDDFDDEQINVNDDYDEYLSAS